MPHKSRFAGFIIDCEGNDLATAAKFWAAALGMPAAAPKPPYVQLDAGPRDLHVEVQTVDHASRVHLDIEADDIPAEVARLERLGAKKLKEVHTWTVMEAPTGQRFCVVRAKDPAAKGFNAWK